VPGTAAVKGATTLAATAACAWGTAAEQLPRNTLVVLAGGLEGEQPAGHLLGTPGQVPGVLMAAAVIEFGGPLQPGTA
jgi:hypothetical protein